MTDFKKIPRKYHPKGYEILYEDRDIIVGNKAAGSLTVAALWNKDRTIHAALNQYVRKGSLKSHKRVYVVHRLDQDTSGVLIFAKTPEAQFFLKDHWKETVKIYDVVVEGKLPKKTDIITSYLEEDEDYVVHSRSTEAQGKLSRTEYAVVQETAKRSLLRVNLLTGRKNQIRVHMADIGHPVVGDKKYGSTDTRHGFLALHARSISFKHPFSRERLTFEVPLPDYFKPLISSSK